MTIYKSCDIRGHFGTELTIRHANRLGLAIATLHKPVKVIVGGDGRLSTPALKDALIDSLVENGCQVVDLSCLPTPAFYFARRKFDIPTGIQVTASHNPPQDNGFKIVLGEMPVTEADILELADFIEKDFTSQKSNVVISPPGNVQQFDILSDYLQSLYPFIPHLPGMKVVVDCANGMGGLVSRQVWDRTGAETIHLNEEVDGNFPNHPPNPAVEKNLIQLRQAVQRHQADLGVAYDGDADRVAFVNELGDSIPNDKVIVLFSKRALRSGIEAIVYDQKCSRIVPDAIRSLGGNPLRERSGHTFIKTTFIKNKAVYAGELSGHHFFREIGGDDGIYASLVFAELVHASRKKISTMMDSIPSYPITPDIRIPMAPDDIQTFISNLDNNLKGQAEIERIDGIRLEFDQGWVLVRPSVTEPVVSLRFEGRDEAGLAEIIRFVAEASGIKNIEDWIGK